MTDNSVAKAPTTEALGPDEHPCAVCGEPNAPFGHGPPGVSFTREPERFRWFCRECRPAETAVASPPIANSARNERDPR